MPFISEQLGRVFAAFFLLIALSLPAQAAEEPTRLVDPPKIAVFRPLGRAGLFGIGETPELLIKGSNPSAEQRNLALEVSVRDFFGAEVARKNFSFPIDANAEFSRELELPAPSDRGFFSVELLVKVRGEIATEDATSFVILDAVTERDHFFEANANANDMELVREMRDIGITVRSIGFSFKDVPVEMRGKWGEFIEHERRAGRHSTFVDKIDLRGAIHFNSPPWFNAEIEEKKAKREFPYSEEFFTEFGDFVEAAVRAYKGKIKVWSVSQEIDAVCSTADDYRLAEFEKQRYIRQLKIVHSRIKNVDPDCQISALSVSLDSENATEPRFSWTKRLLADVSPYFDIFAPDAYCGPWFITNKNRDIVSPERWGFRETLLDAVRFQQSRPGQPSSIAINEKGLMIPYHVAPDDDLERLLANHVSRNLILARSVPEMVYFSHYLVCSGAGYRFFKRGMPSTDDNPLGDEGLWKMFFEGDVRYYRPRSAVAAFATTVRHLANTSDPKELNPRQGIYCYLFQKGDKPVAAVWTTEKKPTRANLQLPAKALLCDLMGNEKSIDPGVVELTLTESPQFISLKFPDKDFADALRGMTFPELNVFSGEIRLKDLKTAVLYLTNRTGELIKAKVEVPAGAVGPETDVTVPVGETVPVEILLKEVPHRLLVNVRIGEKTVAVSGDLSFTPVPKIAVAEGGGVFTKYKDMHPIVTEGVSALFPSSDVLVRGDWKDNEDLSAKAWLAWDETHFRFAVEVTDESHVQSERLENIWKGDCVQFSFNPGNDALTPDGNGQFGISDYSFGIALTVEGPVSYCWVARGKGLKGEEGGRKFPLSIKRDEGGGVTRYEAAIPWEDLAPLKPQPGRAFGFNFAIIDKDASGMERPLYWMGPAPGLVGGVDPSLFKTFVFMPENQP